MIWKCATFKVSNVSRSYYCRLYKYTHMLLKIINKINGKLKQLITAWNLRSLNEPLVLENTINRFNLHKPVKLEGFAVLLLDHQAPLKRTSVLMINWKTIYSLARHCSVGVTAQNPKELPDLVNKTFSHQQDDFISNHRQSWCCLVLPQIGLQLWTLEERPNDSPIVFCRVPVKKSRPVIIANYFLPGLSQC